MNADRIVSLYEIIIIDQFRECENMEKLAHCTVHTSRPTEYVCPRCENIRLCSTCKTEHIRDTGHSPDNCKEFGCAAMRRRIQEAGEKQIHNLARMLRNAVKELEAGFLREIDRLQSSFMRTTEQCAMQTLEREGRFAELYFYVKGMPAGDGAKNQSEKLREEIMKTLNAAASKGVERLLENIAAAAETAKIPEHKPMFIAYKKEEILVIKDKSDSDTKAKVLSALKSADISKRKAIYISPLCRIGDQVALELASILGGNQISAIFLADDDISDAAAETLANAAFRNGSISMFCLCSGRISDSGAKAVAEAARSGSSSLATFFLDGDRMSDNGIKAVTEALKGCPLSAFGVCASKVSDSGVTSLAEMIHSCSRTISAFYLGSWSTSASVAKKVADAVRGCDVMSEFYFAGETLSGETLAYVLDAMANLRSIRSVNLRIGNEVSKEQMDSCLMRLQQDGVEKQMKLRFRCEGDSVKSVCEKCAGERNGEFAEFRIVEYISALFVEEVIQGASL